MPDNLTIYNPYTFINDYIAMVMGMLVCAAAGAIILPPNSRWLWQRLEQDLRGQVVYAISGKLKGLASSFESRTRDLLDDFAASFAQACAKVVAGCGLWARDWMVRRPNLRSMDASER